MVVANVPTFLENERGTYPPLGLLSIAAYLQKHGPEGIHVQVLDTVLLELTEHQVEEYIRNEAPDVVGVQTLTFTLLDSLAMARIAKKVNPDITTVLGGRHCDIYPVETLSQPGVDFVVSGDGEVVMTRLIEHLHDLDYLEGLSGLCFRRGDRVIHNKGILIENLDDLPFPARDLTPYRDYRFLLAKQAVYTTLITSRGCPFGCTYCDDANRKFRFLSAQRVVDEIMDCKRRLGINHFFIFDSTFVVNRQRVLDICKLLVDNKAEISFDIRSRVDLMDDEMLLALRQAGCIRIQYGVESGDNRILANIGKQITVEQVRDMIHRTRKYGFEILCDFMIGLPGETEDEVEKTIKLALELDINYAQFAITTPYPDTKLYDYGMKEGLFGDFWREFSQAPQEGYEAPSWYEYFDRTQLNHLMMNAYKRFYFRGSRVFSEFRNLATVSEFYFKLRAGLVMLQCVFLDWIEHIYTLW
jgi:radical SAM superfamily enzyme YgiQ (UPF0313 family)